MEQACKSLLEAISSGVVESINREFKSFSEIFIETLKSNESLNFMQKFFSKDTAFDQGIAMYRLIAEKRVLRQMDYKLYTPKILTIFKYLLSPAIPLMKYKEAYIVYLDLLSTLQIEPDTMTAFGNLLEKSTYYRHIPRNNQKSKEQTKEKIDMLKQELVQILCNHITDHRDNIELWWYLLCNSIFALLASENMTSTQIPDEPFFNYEMALDFILSYVTDNNHNLLLKYPNIFLLLAVKVSNSKPLYIFRCYDTLSSTALGNIFVEAIKKMDSLSVSIFIRSTIRIFGKEFTNNVGDTNFLKARNHYKTLTFDVWNYIVQQKYAQMILEQLVDLTLISYDSFSIFSLLHLSYLADCLPPKDFLNKISQMDKPAKSEAVAFSCVLAAVFAHQMLNIDNSYQFSFDKDCCTYVVRENETDITKIHLLLSTCHMIRGILILSDSRPTEEANNYINAFFSINKLDINLFTYYACFTETLLMIANNEISPSIKFNPIVIFEAQLHRFIAISDGWLQSELNVSSVSLLIQILETRNCGHNINPSIAIRIMSSLMRAVAISEPSQAFRCAMLLAKVINIGSPIFMVCGPYLISYTRYFIDNISSFPSPTILSALTGICQFYSQSGQSCKPAVESIELRVKQLLRDCQIKNLKFAQEYFFSSNTTNGEVMCSKSEQICSNVAQLLKIWFNKNPCPDVLASITCCIICSVERGEMPDTELIGAFGCDKSLQMFSGDIAVGMSCITEVGEKLNVLVSSYVDMICQTLTDIFLNPLKDGISTNPDINLLFLIADMALRSGKQENIWHLFDKIINSKIIDWSLYVDLLINHVGRCGTLLQPIFQKIRHENAICLAFTSKNVIQVVEDALSFPLIVTQGISGRSAHSFKSFSYPKNAENTKQIVEKIYEPKTEADDCENKPKLFSYVRKELEDRGFQNLLTSSVAFANQNSDKSEEISPISSEGELLSSKFSSNSDSPDFDVTYATMSCLGMYGDFLTQCTVPKVTTDLEKLLSTNWRLQLRVPVTFFPPNCEDLKTAREVTWNSTSPLFQQFAYSLAGISNDLCSLKYTTWNTDVSFDINPLFVKSGRQILNDPQIEIIFFESYIANFATKNQLTPSIYICPLRTGLVSVKTVKSKAFGPIHEEMLVTPDALPALLRATISSIFSTTTIDSTNKLKHIEKQLKMKKWFSKIYENIRVYQMHEASEYY